MAVRQYIGARYVPYIYGEWDISMKYEPLTVVTDGQGNSFISRKEVPPGTELTNTEFWVLSSNYSQQIGSLASRMDDAETNIYNNSNLLAAISPKVLMSNRKILFQGDSYMMQSPSWADLCISYLGLPPENVGKLAGSGEGFITRGSTSNKNFIEELEAYSGTGFTDVVVAAGANDRNQLPNNIKTAIYAYVQKAKEKFGSECTVWIAMCANSKTEGIQIWNYCFEAFKAGAMESGSRFIGDAAFSLNSYKEFIDYLHPSPSGSQNIAMAIANAILGGDGMPYSTSASGTATLLAGTYDGGISVRSTGNNDMVQYTVLPSSGTLDIRFAEPITWTARSYYDLIKFPDDVMFATGGVSYASAMARLRDSQTQQYVSQDIKLRLTNEGVLQISPSEGMQIDIMRCGNIFITTPARRMI